MVDASNSSQIIDFKNWRPLTKSRFKSAIECPTKLFYYGKKEEYSNLSNEDEFLQALAEGGYQVGELAKLYCPGGHDIKQLGYKESLEETNKLLKQENVTIYEAAISFENFFIRVDILKKTRDTIELIEVKAKSYHPEEDDFQKRDGYISNQWKPYLYDIAFQTWVTKQAFPENDIKSFLCLCDKSKVATVDGLNQLFRVKKNAKGRKEVIINKDVNDIELGEKILIKIPVDGVVNMILSGKDTDPLKADKEEQKDFSSRAREYAKYFKDNEKYPVTIGSKCKDCEYKLEKNKKSLKSGYEECWKSKIHNFDITKPHIFEIWYNTKVNIQIRNGVIYFRQLYDNPNLYGMLNERQALQVEKTIKKDLSEKIDALLYDEMESWKFPLHFIDFETSMVAIPFHKGKHPYEQTAFQFSCHSLKEDSSIVHNEWINIDRGVFPNYKFVDALKHILEKDNGTILRYSSYENSVLRQIQGQMVREDESKHAELIEWIDTITEWKVPGTRIKEHGERNMQDMLAVLKKYYYHPLMGGSNSIKAVLPSIFSTSNFIKNRYSKPVGYGINLKDAILYQLDSSGKPQDPYKLLTNQYDNIDLSSDMLILEDGKIQDGAAAMVAYAKLQFSEMTITEKKALTKSLLQYCELDTLAMVMIYEHWKYN